MEQTNTSKAYKVRKFLRDSWNEAKGVGREVVGFIDPTVQKTKETAAMITTLGAVLAPGGVANAGLFWAQTKVLNPQNPVLQSGDFVPFLAFGFIPAAFGLLGWGLSTPTKYDSAKGEKVSTDSGQKSAARFIVATTLASVAFQAVIAPFNYMAGRDTINNQPPVAITAPEICETKKLTPGTRFQVEGGKVLVCGQ